MNNYSTKFQSRNSLV